MLEIDFDDSEAQSVLSQVMALMANTRPVMVEIGEELIEVSKRSFDTSSSPSGVAWASNTETTLLNYLNKLSGSYRKNGKLSTKGTQRAIGKKPLIGQGKDLMRQFSYQADAQSVTVANSMAYAAMQQFGGNKAQFPHLWGNIPSRQFMPIDSAGKADTVAQDIVLRIAQLHIDSALNG